MSHLLRSRLLVRRSAGAFLVAAALAPQAWAQSGAQSTGQSPAQAQAQAGGGARTGKEVYDSVCAACHAGGIYKAPKFGDVKRWKPLIAEGQRSLVRAAIKGIRKMPPRGGNPGLSDLEVERAVVHMANAAGGSFKDPQ
jgi:cytochrome c5